MYDITIIVGNLGKDPEMRYAPSGDAVTSFSVATTKQWKDKGGKQQKKTKWFRVSVWGAAAEACNTYLAKGKQVLVQGELVGDDNGGPRIFTRQDGSAGSSFELTAQVVRFLGKKEGDSDEHAPVTSSGPSDPTDAPDMD